jgi:hypothetical protein
MSPCVNKMKNKQYHTVRTIQKSNGKIVARRKIDTPDGCPLNVVRYTYSGNVLYPQFLPHFNS